MNIEFYRPLWGRDRSFEQMGEEAHVAGFTGLEGHLPDDEEDLNAFISVCQKYELKYIGEICTGGSHPEAYWVPDRSATVDDHLADFDIELKRILSSDLDIPFITCMGGLDAWPTKDACRFFEEAMEMASKANCLVSFETHRTRCMYSPWSTLRILEKTPNIPITCDLSHWCVVAERLIDEEPGLQAVIPLAQHIHGRVGYDQGPQVPDPRAPEYEPFVKAHQNWWEHIWQSQQKRGFTTTTLCTEYGPDGYLHEQPYSREPVVDLWEIMQWVKKTESEHYKNVLKA